ncbi:MAG: VWA domain-containing protein [Pyrinomonadaceae bacterium]|nr:VWA domain-containing protein [Pyrinomonadaceae bacterium]
MPLMFLRLLIFLSVALSICALAVNEHGRAQNAPSLPQQTPTPPLASPTPTPSPETDSQETIRVFTEEVRLPLIAYDEYGRFDPSLETDDVLVLEDNVPQQVRSVRHVPTNVLLLLDTGGADNRGMRTNTTRDVALNVISHLHAEDNIAVVGFSERVEVLQNWTSDRKALTHVLSTKLRTGRRSVVAEALLRAASLVQQRAAGSRHVVLVTDGVESPFETTKPKVAVADAMKNLIAAGATVHVISYTELGRQAALEAPRARPVLRDGRGIIATANDPTGMNRGVARPGQGGGAITFDPAMRRRRKLYEKAMLESEKRLTMLAEETGGRLWLSKSIDEIITQGGEVAREIGAQYTLTYTPKRPLASAPTGEYRQIRVIPRRIGLTLRSRRGYIAKTTP